MMTPAAQSAETILFGPFRLVASERLLTNDGVPVELSARAFDILMVLLSRPTEVFSKSDLINQVWPGITVEESNLRFHIAKLRRALGGGNNGLRYIRTVPGRGYCFVAPITRSGELSRRETFPETGLRHANLPVRLGGMIDREEDLKMLLARMHTERFVTIVGSGGVGKTTLAVAIAHHQMEAFASAVLFVDLGMISDPALVGTVVASMLGLSVRSDDATPSLIAFLRDKRILLILDTCEHLIEAVAALALAIFEMAPRVHILATSRETLRVEGEYVYRLEPLQCAPDDETLTAEAAMTFPATQLFLDRARASGARLDLSDADAAVVVSMCRKLEGVALAIELAARRIEAYGVHETAALLDQQLKLRWVGSRSAPARQRTLLATMDWSYKLLSEIERVVLSRLALFVGIFTIDAALEVAAKTIEDHSQVLGAIDGLVAKSMIATRPIGAMMRYQLLDTTRAYARDNATDDADLTETAGRHATYYRRWLEEKGVEWSTSAAMVDRAPYFIALNNARSALEWCFGANGNAEIGVRLAAAAAPVFFAMSLLPECYRWSERAILALDDNTRNSVEEMRLQSGLGMSLMFTREHSAKAQAAIERSVSIAEQHDDVLNQMLLLGPLHAFHFRTANFQTSLRYAERCSVIAETIGEPSTIALAHCLTGMSLHHMGDISRARRELESALAHAPDFQRSRSIYLGLDYYTWAGIALARTLWLQGHPARAVERAHQAVRDAEHVEQPATLTVILHLAVSVFLWTGDLANAERHIDWFISRAETHSLGPYVAVGRGLKGELAIRRGDAKDGVEGVVASLEQLHAAGYELLTTAFNLSIIRGLTALGRIDEGFALIDQTVGRINKNGDVTFLPELLRLKGSLFLSMPQPRAVQAELCFEQSIELSRRQGTRAWELRTATDLATLFASQGQPERGQTLLRPVFDQFVEGFDTADLRSAERVLSTLGSPHFS